MQIKIVTSSFNDVQLKLQSYLHWYPSVSSAQALILQKATPTTLAEVFVSPCSRVSTLALDV